MDLSNSKNINYENKKEQINKCMLLLQRDTKDEEKFVALLILPKLLDPNDEELMTIVFKKIDFVFLQRLLISEYPDNDFDSKSLYKMISLNIISSFCYYPEFINDKKIIKTIPYMITLINEKEDEEVLNEVLEIFIFFTQNEKTLKEICDFKNIEIINQLIINSNKDEIIKKGIKILTFICQSNYCNSVISILNELSRYFVIINSEVKFKILELFVILFTNSNLIDKKLEDNSCFINIKKGLKILLANKLGIIENDNCMILISSLIRMKGIEFFFSKEENYDYTEDYIENGDKKIKLMENIQFLTLVMHLACTETRVLLDDYKDEDDIKKMEFKNEKEKSKMKNDQKRIQEILPICFEIIEFMIKILVQYSEYDIKENTTKNDIVYNILKKNNINSKWILSFREAMSETMLALIEFITEKVEMYKELQEIEKIDNMIVLLSTRILSSWLSENIEMYEKEIKYIIPALIEIVKIRPKSIDFIPINNISLVFSEITSNEDYQEIFVNKGGIKTLFMFLEDNFIILNENTVLNILITLINIVMLKPDSIKTNKMQWKKIINCYHKYSYTKESNITFYSYLIVIELSIIRLIDSECTNEDEKMIIEDSIDFIINSKNITDDTTRSLWNLSFSILSELSKVNINVGNLLLLNTAKLVALTKDPSFSDMEKQYLNIILNSIRKVSKSLN